MGFVGILLIALGFIGNGFIAAVIVSDGAWALVYMVSMAVGFAPTGIGLFDISLFFGTGFIGIMGISTTIVSIVFGGF